LEVLLLIISSLLLNSKKFSNASSDVIEIFAF
jgi:hypothetical protein